MGGSKGDGDNSWQLTGSCLKVNVKSNGSLKCSKYAGKASNVLLVAKTFPLNPTLSVFH
jgi:hypothetical protein